MLSTLPPELFTPADLVAFAAMKSRAARGARLAPLLGLKAALAALTLLFVIAIEYTAFLHIYQYLKAPLPGEDAMWSPAILALTGAVMVIAFHLRASLDPDALPARLLTWAVDILLPVYMLGAALMFAGILFFDGADGLLASTAGSLDIFAEADAGQGAPLAALFEEYISPLIAILFVLGAGAAVVMGVFVGHRCLGLIAAHAEELLTRTRDAVEAAAAHRDILECQAAYNKASDELLMLARRREEDVAPALAAEIGGVIADELAPFQGWSGEQRINPRPSPYAAQPELNVDEVERRARLIEAITPQEILAGLRGEFAEERRYESASVH